MLDQFSVKSRAQLFIRLMTAAVIGSAVFGVTSQAAAANFGASNRPGDLISDSLVKELRCSTLTPETVLRSLQPDAFSSLRQLPIRNWAAGDGLAECWSLSHAQRLTFYMARFGQSNRPARYLAPEFLAPVEDMFSGKSMASPAVFPVPNLNALVAALIGGFVDGSGKSRQFKTDIEAYQQWRFYQFGNTALLMGSRDRSVEENEQTYISIQRDLQRGRMPMIVLRPSLTGQHVVLIKRVSTSLNAQEPGLVNFDVYDSNSPYSENTISYDRNKREFFAPSVIRALDRDAFSPVGAFVVDNDDMDRIQSELYAYYARRCRIAQ